MTSAKAEIKCTGLVQGVGYRYFCYQIALRFQITGWVKNHPDGSVRLLVEGEKKIIKDFIEELGNGPASSQVSDVIVEWGNGGNEFSEFTIKH